MSQLKLELGCGMSPTPGYVHHDRIRHSDHVDLAWDLRTTPWGFYLNREGAIACLELPAEGSANQAFSLLFTLATAQREVAADRSFLDEILSLDVFEHVFPDIQTWLDECWRLLKPDGLLDFRVPAWDHALSYRDPTHLRVFHPQTMLYWDPDSELNRRFGSIYFAESPKWWRQESCIRENSDLRFRLRKRV